MFILKPVRHQLQTVLTMALSLMSLTSRVQKGEEDDTPRAWEARWMIWFLLTDYLWCFKNSCYTQERTKFY